MTKLLKLLCAVILCALLSTSAVHAAFPLSKETKQAVVTTPSSTANNVASNSVSKRELKKEAKAQMKARYSGGGKKKMTAAILAICCGFVGVHSFYMGNTTKGIAQAVLGGGGIILYIAGAASYVSAAAAATTTAATYPVIFFVGLAMLLAASIWAIVDFVRILTGSLEPEEGFDS